MLLELWHNSRTIAWLLSSAGFPSEMVGKHEDTTPHDPPGSLMVASNQGYAFLVKASDEFATQPFFDVVRL